MTREKRNGRAEITKTKLQRNYESREKRLRQKGYYRPLSNLKPIEKSLVVLILFYLFSEMNAKLLPRQDKIPKAALVFGLLQIMLMLQFKAMK